MKATMDAAQFSLALNKAAKSTGHSRYIELEQVRVDVGSGRCRLTATDLDQFLTAELPAEGETFSFQLCNTQALLKASKYVSGSLDLDYNEEDGELTMTCGSRRSSIAVTTVKDFPELPRKENVLKTYHANARAIFKRFERIKYAIAPRCVSNPSYMGVRFMDDRLVAVDGYRVAIHKDASLNVERPFILREAALRLFQLFGDDEISIEVGERWCVIHADGLRLVTRLLEYDFIHIDDAIPTSFQDEYTVDVQQFTNELNYLRALVPEKSRRPIVFDAGTLKVSAINGEHRSSIQISAPAHVVFGFDVKYMLESLNQFKEDRSVTVKVCSSKAPILLTNNGADLVLVFPVDLHREKAA